MKVFVCTVSLSFTLLNFVYSQSDTIASDTFFLDKEVVITAQRYAIDPHDVPEATSILTQRQLIENSPRSTPEALMGVTGVWMQKTNHGGGSPFIRGLTGNQTLLLIDGIRLNNSTYRYGPNQYLNTIDPLTIQRIEVVRGSGSVEYGTDALGGAAHILTRNPEFSQKGFSVKSEVYGKYMTDDGFMETMETTGRVAVALQGEKVAILGGISYKDFGDLVVGGDSIQAPSSYDEMDGDIKARIQLSPKNILTLAYQHVNQEDVSRYDQVAQRGREFFFFDPQRRQLAYAKTETYGNSRWLDKLTTTVSFQRSVEGRREQRVGSSLITNERDEVNTWGATVELQSQPLDIWTAVSGLEFYHDHIASSAFEVDETDNSRTDRRGLYPNDATAANFGVFSLHTIDLPSWNFTGGLRFNVFDLSAEDETFGDLNVSPAAVVGNIAAVYKIGTAHRLIGSFNTAFRAPNINDLSSFGSFDSGVEVPNDDLDAERARTFEIGYKLRLPQVRTQLALYNTILSNLITRVPTTFQGSDTFNGEPVFTKSNTDEATIKGFEWDISGYLGQVEIYTGMTYTWGEDENDNPIRRIPPFNGRTGVRYSSGVGFWGKVEWLYAAEQDRLSGGDVSDHRIPEGGTPGWSIINLFGGYQFNVFQVGLGLQNLTDELYRIHGSGVDGYGRSLWVSVRVEL